MLKEADKVKMTKYQPLFFILITNIRLIYRYN